MYEHIWTGSKGGRNCLSVLVTQVVFKKLSYCTVPLDITTLFQNLAASEINSTIIQSQDILCHSGRLTSNHNAIQRPSINDLVIRCSSHYQTLMRCFYKPMKGRWPIMLVFQKSMTCLKDKFILQVNRKFILVIKIGFHPIILIWARHILKTLLLETRSTETNDFKLFCRAGFLLSE